MEQIRKLLPEVYAKQIVVHERSEELRIAVGQPVLLRSGNGERFLYPEITMDQMESIVRHACRNSVYVHQDTIRHGFITIEGGHRIGICGTGVLNREEIQSLNEISSIVIRIGRQISGCADDIVHHIVRSTLLIGPPCSGKTTLLRDLIRQLSDRKGQRVSLVDERGEVAAMHNGVSQFSVGKRTDVLNRVPKDQGIMMVLRTMNPQWIAVDEITSPEDIRAMERASYCGVKLLATAHAESIEDLNRRPIYRELMKKTIFQTVITISPDRTYHIHEVEP